MRKTLIVFTSLIAAGTIYAGVTAPEQVKTEAELAAEKRAYAAEKRLDAELEAEGAAILACRAAAQNSAMYPSKADFYGRVTALSDDNVRWSIVGMVDLMNGLGAMIPHQYGCVVEGNTVISVGVRPS